jgi:S-adenosylmethionine uptake transporter
MNILRRVSLWPWVLIIIHILISNAIVIISKYVFTSVKINPFVFVFLRNVVAFLILLPVILPVFLKTYKTHNFFLSFFRSFTGILAMSLWSYGYSHIPLSTATTLTFIVPIITLILARFILKEKTSLSRWLIVCLGFAAVVLALRPSFGSSNIYFILIGICTVLWSFANIFRKISSKSGGLKSFLCYYSFWSVILTFIVALPFISLPELKAGFSVHSLIIPLVMITGVLTAVINIMSFNTYKNNDVGVVQGFDFFRLIFVSIADVFLFNTSIHANLFIGSFLIVVCGIWLVYHESKKLKSVANIQI